MRAPAFRHAENLWWDVPVSNEREVLTYDFDGRFSFAYRDIPRDADVRIEDVRVSENGVEYRQEDSEDPGTFAMTREGRSTRITWRYSANRERRTFTVSYRLRGEVKKYADTAELYYKFVGEQWDRPIGRVTAATAGGRVRIG